MSLDPADAQNLLPSKVRVYFPIEVLNPLPTDPPGTWFEAYTWLLESVTGITASGSPGTKTFQNTCPAYFNFFADPAPINDADLRLLAKQIASDYYAYIGISHDEVFNGVINWAPEGISDCIEFTYEPNDITTRVTTGPINDYPELLLHYEWQTSSSSTSTSSSSSCSYLDGPISVLTDVQCVGGTIKIYTATYTFACGSLKTVGASSYAHDAGCCSCPGSSSSSSSGGA